MTSLRRSAGAFAALLSLGTVGLAPGAAAAPVKDPATTTVTGNCAGGAGRLAVSVTPSATEGMYHVQATARQLRDGTRWKVRIDQLSGRGASVDFGRQVVDGGWTVHAEVPSARRGETLVDVTAIERGNGQHNCDVLNSPTTPTAGLSSCNNPRQLVAVLSREVDDGSTALRLFVIFAPAASRWHFTLTTTGSSSRQVVEYNDVAGKRGYVRSQVTVRGVENPRLHLVASRVDGGGRCVIGLNPADVSTGPASTARSLLKAL